MPPARTQKTKATNRPKLAATINTVKHLLQGQHILDCLVDGYGWDGVYHHPQMDVVSLYVDQAGVGDLSFERAERHPEIKIYPTIMEALTLGTGKLALIAGIDSLYQNQMRVPTPHLVINYRPNPESTYWRT